MMKKLASVQEQTEAMRIKEIANILGLSLSYAYQLMEEEGLAVHLGSRRAVRVDRKRFYEWWESKQN